MAQFRPSSGLESTPISTLIFKAFVSSGVPRYDAFPGPIHGFVCRSVLGLRKIRFTQRSRRATGHAPAFSDSTSTMYKVFPATGAKPNREVFTRQQQRKGHSTQLVKVVLTFTKSDPVPVICPEPDPGYDAPAPYPTPAWSPGFAMQLSRNSWFLFS